MELSPKIVIQCQPPINDDNDDDELENLYAPNPDFTFTFQRQLRELLTSVIKARNKDNRHYNDIPASAAVESTLLGKLRLPTMPTYPNIKHIIDDSDNNSKNTLSLFQKMKAAQHDALTTYFAFSLAYDPLTLSWITDTIQIEAFKRSRQANDNIEYKTWKYAIGVSRSILEKRGMSTITQRIPHSAQAESLILYYYYALIKGPLDMESIKDAKYKAISLYYDDQFPTVTASLTAILTTANTPSKPTTTTTITGGGSAIVQEENNETLSNYTGSDNYSINSPSAASSSDDMQSMASTITIPTAVSALSVSSSSTITVDMLSLPTPKATSAAAAAAAQSAKLSWASMAEKNKSTPVKNLVSNKLSSTTAAGTATTTTTTTATVSGDKVENDIKGTQLCQYYRAGNCARKEACTFAHEDTSRVVICREWKKGFNQCKNGNKCKFLHTEKQAGGERDTSLRKTKLCIYYKTGDCPRTEQQCNFAHEDISKVQKREAWDGFECPDDDECALLHANDRTQLEQSSSPLQPVKRVDLGDEEAFPDLGSGKHNDDGGKYLANETAVSKVNERNNGESYAIAARLRPATVKTSPPSAQFRTAKKSTMERQEDDNTFSASTSSEGSSLNRKTKICEYFRKGNCVFDEESCHYAHEDLSRVHLCYAYLNSHKCEEVLCPYLHQERDINIDIDVDQPARKTKLCLSFLQQKCPYKNEEDCEFAHKDTRKVPICKYWRSNGLCLKDKHCQFLHEEPVVENIDDLIAGALDVKGYPVLTERMKELLIKNVIRSDYNYATAARREPAVSPPPACQPKEKKISCVDETGRAPRGGVIRTHVLHLSDDDNESCAESDEKELRHTKKCRLWWNTDEKCSRYNCWYAHDDTSKVKDCYFWRKGYCSNDTACLYMHRPQDRIDVKYICELPDLSDEDEDNVSMSSSLEDESAMTSEKKIRKCSHFWYGAGCTRKSSVCRYAHEDLQYVSTCYYWQNKKECPSGSACAYKHGESPRELEWDDNARKDIFAKSPPSSSLQQTASGQRAMWLNKLRTPPSPETLPRVASGSENNELRYKSMRAQAFKYGEKMNMETERAAKARQEGNQEEAETHECRALEYSRWMNREHAKASQAIFNACNSDPRHRSRFIDLHGQHVTEAKQHIKRWFDDFQKQRDVVYIVTGAGRHSRKNAVNKGQLRKAIQEYLENMYMCHETHVHGDDSGGVFAVLFCVHEYTSKHSRQCLKCPYYRKQSQQ